MKEESLVTNDSNFEELQKKVAEKGMIRGRSNLEEMIGSYSELKI